MTKPELIERIAVRFSLQAGKDARVAVKMILEAKTNSTAQSKRVEIRGFVDSVSARLD